jgi:hypothetical protein
LNQQPESAWTSEITGKSYRMLLHGKREDPFYRRQGGSEAEKIRFELRV